MLRIQVPATTTNLGPGFDCLGMALKLYNRLQVETTTAGLAIDLVGEGADLLPNDERNLVYQVIRDTLQQLGTPVPGLRLRLENGIPIGRGLGSSAAATLAGIAAARLLAGAALDPDAMLAPAVAREGHPDNVVPALVGGFTVAAVRAGSVEYFKLPVPDRLRAVLLVPDLVLETARARAVLPEQVSRADAVHNLQGTALVVTALLTGQLERLGTAMADRLHEPYRAALIPGMPEALAAARAAGAVGTCLSGAGSTLLAFATEGFTRIGEAMQAALAAHGLSSRVLVLEPEAEGLKAERLSEPNATR
jgi:homoserine kinase